MSDEQLKRQRKMAAFKIPLLQTTNDSAATNGSELTASSVKPSVKPTLTRKQSVLDALLLSPATAIFDTATAAAAEDAHGDVGVMRSNFRNRKLSSRSVLQPPMTLASSDSVSVKRSLQESDMTSLHLQQRQVAPSLSGRSVSLNIESATTIDTAINTSITDHRSILSISDNDAAISDKRQGSSEQRQTTSGCLKPCFVGSDFIIDDYNLSLRPTSNASCAASALSDSDIAKEQFQLQKQQQRQLIGCNGVSQLPCSRSTPNFRTEQTVAAFLNESNEPLQQKPLFPGSQQQLRLRPSTSKRFVKRLVHKNGDCNVSHVNVPKQSRKYLSDIFTTLIDVKWRWGLLIFSGAFLLSWTIFGIVYYLICLFHGDLEPNGSVEAQQHCITKIQGFSSAFLYSVETQHTIGYGHRFVTEHCPIAMVTMCIQCIVGIMIQAFMTGFVFAKLARPKKRAETLIFSKNAVIAMQDGKLCFLLRVGDMRKSHIVEAHVRLQMIKKRLTNEGELLPFHQFDMDVGYEEGLDRIFLVWPITISHVIDENSPLYEYSKNALQNAHFEIVAILEGVVESTGMTTQARTSYIPSEILWGHRFEKLVTYQRDNGEYTIDFARFHKTNFVDTPTLSAKELDSKEVQIDFNEQEFKARIKPLIIRDLHTSRVTGAKSNL